MGARVFKALTVLSAVFASTGCAAIGDDAMPMPMIENHLGECVELSPTSVRVSHASLLLEAQVRVIQPIGGCGCVSAMASYHSVVLADGEWRLVHRGEMNLKAGGVKSFDLGGADAGGVGARSLRLMCGGPR